MKFDQLEPEAQKTMCIVPFSQLALHPEGRVSACCWNQNLEVGYIQENEDIPELWNSKMMQSLRKEFLDGRPLSCQKHIKELRCHIFFRHLKDKIDFKLIQNKMPIRLDIRLNGECNLRCKMCDVWQHPNHFYDDKYLWSHGPETIFPYLEEVDLLGGEPFIQKDTFRFIDAVSSVNSKCSWAFATNGYYNFRDEILPYLQKIPVRWIMVSIDSLTPETHTFIRTGSELEVVLNTLEDLLEYRDSLENPFRVIASMCVQQQNWKEAPKFAKFCHQRAIEPVFQFAAPPYRWSLAELPIKERREIHSTLLKEFETLGRNDHMVEVLGSLKASLEE